MIIVYICSPLKGKINKNKKLAQAWSKVAYKLGYLPICSHIYLEQATGLKESKHREYLLYLGKELLKMCDECWVCTPTITEGMQSEIEIAKKMNMPVRKIYQELCDDK